MNIRFLSLQQTFDRQPVPVASVPKRSEIFNKNVFTDEKLKQYIDKKSFREYVESKQKGKSIDRRLADVIASAMKTWAIENGATHYTHWFQPLTGATAEKHDSFLEKLPDGEVLEVFSGNQLVQQEPDASSFPSGGLRNTFEARGYTAWDPSSPAFIYGTTLCIPSVFISYNGEALDYKTPLLRSAQALDKYATEVAQLFNRNVEKVYATLGWEQEYFLVDTALYKSRPDLIMTGRTLVGHPPAKNQQMEDHYFGSIPERVMAFMRDLEIEAMKIGIPVKTRHNEVAPGQYEIAPVFEEVNLAVDHNSLLMDIMKKVARRHRFEVLLHEKPFAYINGSGKHNNWSLMTDTGINLLSPGETPRRNLRFLTFFVNTIKAVNDYEELVRASIASAGNDHRLGANEAPPAIVSVFIGDYMTGVLREIKHLKSGKLSPDEKTEVKLQVLGKIPAILRDNTDRNRTSPFAFTGNKFEIRSVGSSANCASPMITLNAVMAKQLKTFLEDLRKETARGLKKDEAILKILKKYIKSAERILFEGNGYSEEWRKEAAERGLSDLRTTPEALKVFLSDKVKKLFAETGIYTETELQSRYNVQLEQYVKHLEIEANVLSDLVSNHIIPTVIHYQSRLTGNIHQLKKAGNEKFTETSEAVLADLSQCLDKIFEQNRQLKDALKKLNSEEDEEQKATFIVEEIKPLMENIRRCSDELEMQVDDELWPLTKYRELLFTR